MLFYPCTDDDTAAWLENKHSDHINELETMLIHSVCGYRAMSLLCRRVWRALCSDAYKRNIAVQCACSQPLIPPFSVHAFSH